MTRQPRPAMITSIAEPDPVCDVPAGELEQLSDIELLRVIRSRPRESAVRDMASEVLVNRYRPLVKSCVRRFQNSPEPYEDLLQVGYVGLIKAINNYDPEAGTSLGIVVVDRLDQADIADLEQVLVWLRAVLEPPHARLDQRAVSVHQHLARHVPHRALARQRADHSEQLDVPKLLKLACRDIADRIRFGDRGNHGWSGLSSHCAVSSG